MKVLERNSGLRPFSDDDLRSLALAREVARACEAGEDTPQLAREVAARFDTELARHMAAEERYLLPALERAGEGAHALRVKLEHEQLRALAVRLRAGEAAALSEFAEAMRRHVRYEERELWAAAEKALGPQELARLAAAAPTERGSKT